MDVTWDTTGRWLSVIEPCLPHLSFFLPSSAEAQQIAGTNEPKEIAAFLQGRGVETVVIKLGEKGCFVKQRREPGFFSPAFHVTPVDTTGAGDSFVAGFLTGVLRGWSMEESAEFACGVSALNIRAVGAAAGIPTFEEARQFIRSQKGSAWLQERS